MRVPHEFIEDYEKCDHYLPGDKVVDIELGKQGELGYIFINLIIERDIRTYRLPFYFNQVHDEEDLEDMRDSPNRWLAVLAGATNWVGWYNSVDLQEV